MLLLFCNNVFIFKKQDIISLIRLLDNYFDCLFLCTSRKLEISNFYKSNFAFAFEVAREKWLPEFPDIKLVLDRLEKRDPFFIPPTNTNYDFLYYHLPCSKKLTLKECDKIGFKVNYEHIEIAVIGKNATEYFNNLVQ